MPPKKNCNTQREAHFSEWVESLRKDIECAFGIMKKRWRILKYGIRFHGILNFDMVWLTCCTLHNYLLDVDGLSEQWDEGLLRDIEEDDNIKDLPFAIRNLMRPTCAKFIDHSSMGRGKVG